jgi:hypothetical protein
LKSEHYKSKAAVSFSYICEYGRHKYLLDGLPDWGGFLRLAPVEVGVQVSVADPKGAGKLVGLVQKQGLLDLRIEADHMDWASSTLVGCNGDAVAGTGAYTEVAESQEETSVA